MKKKEKKIKLKTSVKFDLEAPKIDTYTPDETEKNIIALVDRRRAQMTMSRRSVDKDWSDYQAQIDAIWQPYPDGRSSFALPITRALIERGMAEEVRIPYQRQIRASQERYQDRALAYEEVRKEVGRRGNFDWQLNKNAFTCWGIGTSIIYSHFERTVKEQYDASFTALDDIQYQKKYIIQNGILVEDFNINNFYPDNEVTEWSEANDCIAVQIVPFETFRALANQPIYKNIDKVKPTGYWGNTQVNNISQEERAKTGEYVHIVNYWNLAKDMYVSVANGVVIRLHPIWTTQKGAKCIPFTMRKLWYKERSLYGVGMCYYGQQLQSNMNDISEMIFDGVRRSTEETTILGSNLEIEWQKIVFGNRILKANGILKDNIDRYSGTAPNSTLFEAREMIIKDITRFIGLDLENLVASASTAFQANLIAESQQKQINVWLRNRDMAMQDVEEKILDLCVNYYPLDIPYRIVDDLDDVIPETPQIEVQGKKYDKQKKKFSVSKNPAARTIVDIDEEMLKGDYWIEVSTNPMETASIAVRQQQLLSYATAIPQLLQAEMIAKQSGLENVIDVKTTIDELTKAYNIPKKEPTNEADLRDKKDEYKQKLIALAQSQGIDTSMALAAWQQSPEQQQIQQSMTAQGGTPWAEISQPPLNLAK